MVNDDLKRFKRMTKGLRFRKGRLTVRYIKDWLKALSSVIKYNIYNILYKLKIYDRYTYRDEVQVDSSDLFPLPDFKIVDSPVVSAILQVKCFNMKRVNLDYFFRKTKSGEKRFYLSNEEHNDYSLEYSLSDIVIHLDKEHRYHLNDLPSFRVRLFSPEADLHSPVGLNSPMKPLELDTKDYDFSSIPRLHLTQRFDIDILLDSRGFFTTMYKEAYHRFTKTLGEMKISDFIK